MYGQYRISNRTDITTNILHILKTEVVPRKWHAWQRCFYHKNSIIVKSRHQRFRVDFPWEDIVPIVFPENGLALNFLFASGMNGQLISRCLHHYFLRFKLTQVKLKAEFPRTVGFPPDWIYSYSPKVIWK